MLLNFYTSEIAAFFIFHQNFMKSSKKNLNNLAYWILFSLKATDADDKAKGRKKDMMSFFQSTATLKRHAGKLSVKQEELDIRWVNKLQMGSE